MIVEKAIKVYTDGSANNRLAPPDRIAGYSAVILDGDERSVVTGARKGVSSQVAEMLGVIIGLNFVQEKYPGKSVRVVLYSDSAYIVNCFKEKWYETWIATDYLMKMNKEYWEVIVDLALNRGMKVHFWWVPGHKGVGPNEEADQWAEKARKRLEKKLNG